MARPRRHWAQPEPGSPPPTLRCRVGLHAWTRWGHSQERWYQPQVGSEGFIYTRLYQLRFCKACTLAEREDVEEGALPGTVSSTINEGLLTNEEREHLWEHETVHRLDNCVVDAVDAATDIGWLCRIGLHRDVPEHFTGLRFCSGCWSVRYR